MDFFYPNIIWQWIDMQEGYASDSAAYNDPSTICDRLQIIMQKTQKLRVSGKL